MNPSSMFFWCCGDLPISFAAKIAWHINYSWTLKTWSFFLPNLYPRRNSQANLGLYLVSPHFFNRLGTLMHACSFSIQEVGVRDHEFEVSRSSVMRICSKNRPPPVKIREKEPAKESNIWVALLLFTRWGHVWCRISAIRKDVWPPLTIEITLLLRWIIFLWPKARNHYAFWRAGIVLSG